MKSTMNQIFTNNHHIWFNIQTIELNHMAKYDQHFFYQLNHKMPKLKFIKFTNSWLDFDGHLNDDPTKQIFNYVTTIQFDGIPMEDRQDWLIHQISNLKHLILSSIHLPSTNNQLTQILNQRIQRLDIDQHSRIDELINTTYIYFSNVQYINFRLYENRSYQYYAHCVMQILKIEGGLRC